MTDETQHFVKEKAESAFGNLSVRALLAIMVTATICILSCLGVEVREPLYTMGGMMIAFYFAQKERPKGQATAI